MPGMSKPATLMLVDGSSYLYRAFHALPALSNSRGQHTGAVYGVINMVRRLMREYQPEYVAVVFDAKGKTFRDDLYPAYKANRPPMPDELRSQVPLVHDLVSALGLPLVIEPGVEADDVIATLARQARKAGMQTIVSSGDKDLAQLVDGGVKMIDTMTNVEYDRAMVETKFGVPPERIVDFLTLVGDSSDNVPGVPKVGPKTAAKWLQEYGSLDEVIAHAGDIGGKVGESLRASIDQLPLSRQLVTVKDDVTLTVTPQSLAPRAPDKAKLHELFSSLEFSSWLSELGEAETAPALARDGYEIITDAKTLDTWLTRLREAGAFAFDTETTSLRAVDAELVGVSFAVTPGAAAYVPLAHDYPGAPEQLPREQVLARLKPLLENASLHKIGQNLKYDHCVLAGRDIALNGITYDTMLESYVLDSVGTRHDLDSLALKFLAHQNITFEQVAGKGKTQLTFNQVDVELAGEYAAEDADVALRLHQVLWPRLEQDEKLREVFARIEMPLVPVLSRMERNGVKIDTAMLAQQSGELSQRIMELEKLAHKEAGGVFNIASPKQLQEILYDRLGLPVLRKTPKGQPSTAENVLQDLAVQYELPRLILEYRALSKLQSTYTDKLPEMVNPRTGRVHTSYHQAVAATGRLSSSEPNLQNIPVRTAEGRRIRSAFVPEPGHVLVSADYSQVELRIMAHLSGDERLRAAFASGADIHRATAAEVFGLEPGEVSDDQRRAAKAINFGLIYGMSAFGLAQQLRIERGAAQQYIDLYFARYPGVQRFMEQTRAQAREQGYVETVFGRRLYVPDIKASNHARRQYAERTAINAPMQGTAADLIKMAMLMIDDWLQAERPGARMIMQVHDELVFEVENAAAPAVAERVAALMTGVAELAVPLEVDVGTGGDWAAAHT